jgi:DNA topoisomerase III
VAEKNDAAKNISRILGNNPQTREGKSKYNKLYCFNMDCQFGRQCPVIFTSVSGHLKNYEFEPAMKKWEEVPIERLFDAQIFKMTMSGMDKIDETLR